MGLLTNKKILLGVSGSIAAYKSVFLLRLLQKEGADVKIILSSHAADFIAPLTFESISHHPVYSSVSTNHSWNNHVDLGLWADVFVIAPASAHTISRLAHGMADDMISVCYLSARCPVIIAPSMDVDMWHHAATKANIQVLKSRNVKQIPVGYGELASGLIGEGRMAEPEDILQYLVSFLNTVPKFFIGKKVIITAGPTYENIDPVRFIGNASSGKMGIAIADRFAEMGAAVNLILGPGSLLPKHQDVQVTHVHSAAEMFQAALQLHPGSDISIFAAAVADYRPEQIAVEKIKKLGETMQIKLVKNPDIALELGKLKKPGQLHIGFALESTSGEVYAKEKLAKKNFDMIVLNSLRDQGAGFAGENNKTTFFFKNNKSQKFELKPKSDVAVDIVDAIMELIKVSK